jgi:small conductance mechanosensitive channel
VDFQRAWNTILDMVNGTIASLPNLVLAILIFVGFYILGKRTNSIVRSMTEKRQKARHAGIIMGKLAQSGVITAGILVVLTIVFPSFRPGDLIQLLGIGSVAIGFAFHDIFQNFVAGIILLLAGPFRVGDEISIDQYEGTVEDIQTRATSLRTYDGRRIVIPNSDLFTNSVTVYTAFRTRQIQYDLTIDFNEDIAHAKQVLLEVVNSMSEVLQEPKAEVLVTGLTDAGIVLHISCWTQLRHQAQVLRLQDSILTTIKDMLVAENIQLPTQTQKILVENLRTSQNGVHPENTAQIEAGQATDVP